ncbi:MAG: helix-turn-helix transcriptional regulator [Bacillales bacterium]|nr:helix-turn-helix transcriptional regulator [Bacillales bacterium]
MKAYERIKYLRKNILKYSQEEFSNRINISRSNLGGIEIGRVNLTDRVINDICREFLVNKNWITEGIEPIFEEANDPFTNEIIKIYTTLNDDNKKYLMGYMHRLLEEQSQQKNNP